MITLYELHWSHYCEKVRWALNFKKLSWKKISINAITKKEIALFQRAEQGFLVPQIYDERTKKAIGESSSILQYLEETYPESPALFPKDETDKKKVSELLIEFDSKLAVISRRLGYTQIILEKPTILSNLILATICKGVFNLPGIRHITSAFLGMIIIKRFRCDLNESLFLYEELESYLLNFVETLKTKPFLVGKQFTAADLTLAVHMRPLAIIPFFKENPDLAPLFEWRNNLIKEYQGEDKILYETLIEEHRKTHSPVRRKIRSLEKLEFFDYVNEQIKNKKTAFNDHNPIWTWSVFLVPYYYYFKIRRNKIRQRLPSPTVR